MNALPSACLRLLSSVACRLSPVCCLLSPVACLLLPLLAFTGCSSLLPQPHSDPTRFYVLGTEATRSAVQPDAPVVHLREVELASYLRTRPMIVRRGENEIEFREFALWGEPLEQGLARVLREELLARGAASAVLTSSIRRAQETESASRDLSVRVLACEGGAGGSVAFRAVWELKAAGAKAGPVAQGDYRATDLRWDGKSEASLAAQLSQAVAGLAGEIAAALVKR